jgi:hypothetical protein
VTTFVQKSLLVLSSSQNDTGDNMKFLIASSLLTSALAFTGPNVNTQKARGTSMVLNNDLWGQPPGKEGDNGQRSKALPFAPRPKLLDGTLAGDVGFE